MAQVLTEITDIENTWMGDPPECGFANYVRKHGQPMRITERTMMKTAELIGAFLDSWVARAEGLKPAIHCQMVVDPDPVTNMRCTVGENRAMCAPSSDWAQGGPIVQREMISVYFDDAAGFVSLDPWVAGFGIEARDGHVWSEYSADSPTIEMTHGQRGPTPLVAAMRAYVASKFGKEVADE